MSLTPLPTIDGYANYVAAVCITNGTAPTDSLEIAPLWAMPQEEVAPLHLLKSLDDLDEETDEDDDDADLEDEDDEDEEDDDDDLDEDVDEDEDDDEDDEDEDEEEEEEDGGVKPLKVRVQ